MATKVTNGLDLLSQRIQNLGTPSADADAATKVYVDSVARGLDWKQSARAASTGNVTLATPGTTIDGVTLAANDRVLLKDQTSGAENGVYTWSGASAALVRAVDADSDAEVTSGLALSVTEGTANGDKVFVLTTNDPIDLDIDELSFTPLSGGGGSYTAGLGIDLSGSEFSVAAGTGLVQEAAGLAIDANVVPQKKAFNVGDGSATAITVTHSLNTRDVQVEVFALTTPWDTVLCDVTRPDVNTVTLTFATAPASGAYRAVVVG